MGLSLSYKLLQSHLVEGELAGGREIAVKIDQTLTQDATGTMAYLQFEALGIPKVKTEISVSYVDHNTLQTGFENADDHRFLQSIASKYGIHFSKPGNGICHQIHLERFAAPGKTLLGSDSHTPTAGGIGMIAIGAGGLDVAVAMGGGAFYLKTPQIVNIILKGKLPKWTAAKDIILEILRRLGVKGGVGKIFEYGGPGVESLSIPERATITNMGAELGATTSVFPSDEITKKFLKIQKRLKDFTPIKADEDALYDEIIEVDLSKLEPLIAQPHSPDSIAAVKSLNDIKVQQVCIGSCTNSSINDLAIAAKMLKGKQINPEVSLTVSPGSKQVLLNISESGALSDLIASGARILECTCGPCIGMGQAPSTRANSVRSFNRNFLGRSGTKSANVYLASVETCIASAISGKISDPASLGISYPRIEELTSLTIDDTSIIPPQENGEKIIIHRGPNIKPLPINQAIKPSLKGKILLKVGDNITTDHIMPAGAKILPLRSNIPAISEHLFSVIDSSFAKRAKENKGGFILGGENYGQGSSREHAALAPMFLGIKAVITKSFARIHYQNLINFGILPLVFINHKDYDDTDQNDEIEISRIKTSLQKGPEIIIKNITKNTEFTVKHFLTERQIKIILAGGLLNYTKTLQ